MEWKPFGMVPDFLEDKGWNGMVLDFPAEKGLELEVGVNPALSAETQVVGSSSKEVTMAMYVLQRCVAP